MRGGFYVWIAVHCAPDVLGAGLVVGKWKISVSIFRVSSGVKVGPGIFSDVAVRKGIRCGRTSPLDLVLERKEGKGS